jgi:hypothetical protein
MMKRVLERPVLITIKTFAREYWSEKFILVTANKRLETAARSAVI